MSWWDPRDWGWDAVVEGAGDIGGFVSDLLRGSADRFRDRIREVSDEELDAILAEARRTGSEKLSAAEAEVRRRASLPPDESDDDAPPRASSSLSPAVLVGVALVLARLVGGK